jgi:hypothetical protein
MGEARIQGGTIDRGAYEFNGSPAISVVANDSSICAGTPVVFTANAFNQGTNPVYQWQLNGSNITATGNTFTSSALANNDRITVILTSNASCLQATTQTSQPVIMQVGNASTPSVTINGQTGITAGQQVPVVSSAVNAGSSPTYQWQDSTAAHSWTDISGSSLASITYTAQPGNKLRLRLTSSELCANPQQVYSNVLRFEVITAIGPEPASRFAIKIYPNPANSFLVLDSLKLSDRWKTIELTSSTGQSALLSMNVAGKEKVMIPLDGLSSGFYFLIIRDEKHRFVVYRVIKI